MNVGKLCLFTVIKFKTKHYVPTDGTLPYWRPFVRDCTDEIFPNRIRMAMAGRAYLGHQGRQTLLLPIFPLGFCEVNRFYANKFTSLK